MSSIHGDWTRHEDSLDDLRKYMDDVTIQLGWNFRGGDACLVQENPHKKGAVILNVWNGQDPREEMREILMLPTHGIAIKVEQISFDPGWVKEIHQWMRLNKIRWIQFGANGIEVHK